jgi:hypothetical protein
MSRIKSFTILKNQLFTPTILLVIFFATYIVYIVPLSDRSNFYQYLFASSAIAFFIKIAIYLFNNLEVNIKNRKSVLFLILNIVFTILISVNILNAVYFQTQSSFPEEVVKYFLISWALFFIQTIFNQNLKLSKTILILLGFNLIFYILMVGRVGFLFQETTPLITIRFFQVVSLSIGLLEFFGLIEVCKKFITTQSE